MTPMKPCSASFGRSSTGKCCDSSHSRTCGAISPSANSRTLILICCCSSLSSKSIKFSIRRTTLAADAAERTPSGPPARSKSSRKPCLHSTWNRARGASRGGSINALELALRVEGDVPVLPVGRAAALDEERPLRRLALVADDGVREARARDLRAFDAGALDRLLQKLRQQREVGILHLVEAVAERIVADELDGRRPLDFSPAPVEHELLHALAVGGDDGLRELAGEGQLQQFELAPDGAADGLERLARQLALEGVARLLEGVGGRRRGEGPALERLFLLKPRKLVERPLHAPSLRLLVRVARPHGEQARDDEDCEPEFSTLEHVRVLPVSASDVSLPPTFSTPPRGDFSCGLRNSARAARRPSPGFPFSRPPSRRL